MDKDTKWIEITKAISGQKIMLKKSLIYLVVDCNDHCDVHYKRQAISVVEKFGYFKEKLK